MCAFFVKNIFQVNRQLDDPFSRHGKKCKKGQHWETPAGKCLRKKTLPHWFFFKSTGDGCNSVICHCDVEAKNAKTGKVFCSKTEVGCDPPKDSKDSGGEFPILQILSSIFLYNSYSKRTDNVTTHFHVTARSAQKRSAGKRLPVSETITLKDP